MNFGSSSGGGGGSGGATGGPDLDQIETEQIAFQTPSGEDKLRLLPSSWPTNNLPQTTASLLSIASTKGLLAAASPDTLVIASTDSVRDTFKNGTADADKVKAFTPQSSISIPRVSQVVFSSDESCLVISAEQGGGLAVYDTNALTNGGKEPAFQLATEGQSVRQLLPNPNPSADLSRYFGVVTENGQLLLADLKEQKLVQPSSGSSVFHEKVSCACWSRLGKQLVAGLADGTAVQIDQQGVVKATIPEPPQLGEIKANSSAVAHPITSIFWLDTHDFLIIHTPINQGNDGMPNDDSIYHLAHRDKASGTFTFSKFEDPCTPFGMESRKPAHHFTLRLREWLSLSDLIVLSSTASTDIGIFTRSKSALDPEHVPSTSNDTFTYTRPPDARRAEMPMGAEGDTSPIGMALDLSVKEKIPRPIPTDETMDESPVALPALVVLNNEGMLSLWYVVYNESIRQRQPYPDLVAAGGPRSLGEQRSMSQPQQQTTEQQSSTFGASSFGTPAASAKSPFGSSANQQSSTFGQSSAFGGMNSSAKSPFGMQSQQQQQSQSTFGTPSQPTSTFGQPSQQSTSTFGQPSAPAFGGASSLGGKQSPWGANTSTPTTGGSTFGKPAFGASTFGQPSAFGQAGGGMGTNRGSVWGTPQASQQQQTSTQQATPSTGTFGSSSVFGGNASQSSPFMSLGNTQQSQSPFAAAGKTGSSLSNQSSSNSGSGSAFGNLANTASPFATASKPTLSAEQSGSTVSFGSGMSFGSGNTSFGVRSLGSPTPTPTLGQSAAGESREESMQDEDEQSETSTAKPTEGGLGGGFSGFKLGSTFKGDGTAKDDLPKPKDAGAGLFGKNFGEALGMGGDSSAAAAGGKKANDESRSGSEAAWWSGRSTPVGNNNGNAQPQIKKEPGTEEQPKLSEIPAAPAPTQQQKKETTPPVDDAPLPPDPTTWKPKPGALAAPVPPGFESVFGKKTEGKKVEDAPLPPDPATAAKDVPAPGQRTEEQVSEGVQSPSQSQEAAGPPESEGDEEEWSDEDEGDVEADEDDDDVDEEDYEEDHTPQVIEDAKGLSAFEARLTPADPKRSQQQQKVSPSPSPASTKQQSTTPATEPKKDSYTPAGMPKAPVMFQPPQQQRSFGDSPRSPSPQRNVTSPARAMGTSFGTGSSASSFGKPSQPSQLPPPSQPRNASLLDGANAAALQGGQHPMPQQQAQQKQSQGQSQQPQRISVPAAQLVSSQQQQKKSAASTKPAELTEGTLEDEEDTRIQSLLAAPIEPTQGVPAFLAHQDYVALSGHSQEKEGLGGQIERVFRDVNSMIDTLALNARSLRGFVEGNKGEQQSRGRLDLEEEEGWVLGEAAELEGIVEGIEVELEDGKLEDVRGAVEGLRDEEKTMARLRTMCAEVRKGISAREDPQQLAQRDAKPLSLESQAQLTDLRERATSFQELLAKAEEALSVLRAELASLPSGAADGSDGRSRQVPTVEAVMNTIRKMISMIEKKSGDVDVLESQICKLGGPAALGLSKKADYEDDLVTSLKASRISNSSPNALRSSRVGMYGSPVARRLRESTRYSPSPGAEGVWGKKSLLDVDEGEVEAYRVKREGRRRAMEVLREQLEVRGPRVVKISE